MLTDKELEEIRRKLLELEEEPPVNGWKSIKAEVQPPVTNWRPVWWFGATLLLLLIGTGVYFASDNDNNTIVPEMTAVRSPLNEVPASKDELQQQYAAQGKGAAQPYEGKNIPEQILPDRQVQAYGSAQAPLVKGAGDSPPGKPGESASRLPSQAQSPEQVISRISVHSPKAPLDSVNSEKVVDRSQRMYALSGVPDTLAKENIKQINADKLQEQNTAARDSGALSEPYLALQPVATDSAASQALDPEKKEKPAKPKKERAVLNDPSGWAVGAYFSPRYAFRKFSPNGDDAILITRLNTKSQLDPERMGYEAGASISKFVKTNMSLEAGLSLVNLKENVDYTYTSGQVSGSQMRQTADGQIVVEATPVMEERQLLSSYTYGGVRVGVNYFFLQNQRTRLNLTEA